MYRSLLLSPILLLAACKTVANDEATPEEPACDAQLLYADADGDGFGDPASGAQRCEAAGLTPFADDCDDGDETRFPGAEEILCNGQVDNCSIEAESEVYAEGRALQSAIDRVGVGGTVCVPAGDYDEVRVSGQDVIAIAGRDETIISVRRSATGVTMTGGTLTGFSIEGGAVGVTMTGSDGVELSNLRISGAVQAMEIQTSRRVSILDTTIADTDGGIEMTTVQEVTLRDVSFQRASATGGTPALQLTDAEDVSGEALSFEGNEAGALSMLGSRDVEVLSSEFSDNRAELGAAIYAENSAGVYVFNSTFEGNSARSGGAIALLTVTDVELNSVRLLDNEATAFAGGGLFAYNSSVYVLLSTISDNRVSAGALGAWGGGALFWAGEVQGVANSWLNNSSAGNGGAAAVMDCTASFEDNFEENTAGLDGGGLYRNGGVVTYSGSAFWANTPQDVF